MGVLNSFFCRQARHGKRGKVPGQLPPIIERLGYSARQWQREMQYYGRWYVRAVGGLASIESYCHHLGQKWLKGQARHRRSIAVNLAR